MAFSGSGIELQSGMANQAAKALTKLKNALRETENEVENDKAGNKSTAVREERATSAVTWVSDTNETTGDTVSLSQPDFEIETPELNLAALMSATADAAGFVIETLSRKIPDYADLTPDKLAILERLPADLKATLDRFGEAVKARNNANKNIPFLESLNHEVGTALAALDCAGVPRQVREIYVAKLYAEGRTTNESAVRDTLMIEQKSLLT